MKNGYDTFGKKISRWAVLWLTAAGLFELLNRNLVGEVSFSGIKVTHLSFLLYFIPPLVAMSFLNLATFNIEQNLYRDLITEFAKQKFPELHAPGLVGFLFAQSGALGPEMPTSFGKPRIILTLYLSLALQILVVPTAYLTFDIYAYIQLFSHASATLPAVISLCVSAVLFALSIPLITTQDAF